MKFTILYFAEAEESKECKVPVTLRSKNNNNTSSVRRISYLRATANDISVQETESIGENIVETLVRDKDNDIINKHKDSDTNDELQQFVQYLR